MKAEITKLPNITTDGLLATSGGDGTLGVASGTENDLLQANNLGVFEAKSPTLVNKSLTPFLQSPLAGIYDLDNVFAWDSFNRPNGALGTSDSGHEYSFLQGTGFAISDNRLISQAVVPALVKIDTPLNSQYVVKCTMRNTIGTAGNRGGFVLGKDVDNWIGVRISRNNVALDQNIGGVVTQILNSNPYTTISGLYIGYFIDYYLQVYIGATILNCRLWIPQLARSFEFNLASVAGSFNAGFDYFGFQSVGTGANISNYTLNIGSLTS